MKSDRQIKLQDRNQYYRDNLIDVRISQPIESWKTINDEIISYGNSLQTKRVRVLDGGAGEGRYRKILNEIKNLEYIGVDNGCGSDNWDFSSVIKASLSNLEFIDNESLDIIILIQVLSHIENLDECIHELSKKIKKNGKLFITTQNMQSLTHVPYDFMRLTPYGIKKNFEKYGFKIEKIQPQFYGDNVSASKQLQYAFLNNINNCDSCGLIIKLFSRFMIIILRVLDIILKNIDKKRESQLNPVGYYAVLKKA